MTDGRARGPQVSIKKDAKDGAWIVFAGLAHEVREDIIETFGLTTADFDGQSLAAVVTAAESVFQGNAPLTAVKALGGSIAKVEETSQAPAPSSEPAPAPAPTKIENPEADIKGAKDKSALAATVKTLKADGRFTDELKSLAKARAAEL